MGQYKAQAENDRIKVAYSLYTRYWLPEILETSPNKYLQNLSCHVY